MSIWNLFVLEPLTNLLVFTYQAMGNNLGLAIVVMTILVRLALIPLTNPGMKSAQRMQELKPELDKLKEKFKDDKQALAQAQLQLYKEKGINPAGSLLPMILQFIVLIGLFQTFNLLLKPDLTVETMNSLLYNFQDLKQGFHFNSHFFSWDLTRPDIIALPQPLNLLGFKLAAIPGVLLLGSAAVQFLSSKFMMPKKVIVKQVTPSEPDMATMMQKQMMYMMPIMTILIGYSFPTGLVLYWLTFSTIMAGQQLLLKNKAQVKSKL